MEIDYFGISFFTGIFLYLLSRSFRNKCFVTIFKVKRSCADRVLKIKNLIDIINKFKPKPGDISVVITKPKINFDGKYNTLEYSHKNQIHKVSWLN
jgi:hypothetical protein